MLIRLGNANKGQVINTIKSFRKISVNDVDLEMGVKGFKYMISKDRITCRRRSTWPELMLLIHDNRIDNWLNFMEYNRFEEFLRNCIIVLYYG